MSEFHYKYVKEKYRSRAKLLFTDSDSFTYEVETEDLCRDLWEDKERFDNSDYPETSTFLDKTNKNVSGKFKDEAAGAIITEFVGLRSKMYSYVKEDGGCGKTVKGMKNVIKKNIKHVDYRNTLQNSEQMHQKNSWNFPGNHVRVSHVFDNLIVTRGELKLSRSQLNAKF